MKNNDKMERMSSLLRTFCETGGNLVQFNFASNEVLRAAQKIRINTGIYWSEWQLILHSLWNWGPETQEDIIKRNELE